ncbi:MAG: hypothetical protein AB8B53_08030 [Flavobacteriales bacterium]
MEKVISTILLCILALSVLAGDILTLKEGLEYEGKVTKIKDCTVVFKMNKNRFEIPSTEIYSIQFEDITDKVYLNYLSRAAKENEKCLKGRLDAENLHGRKGGHVLLGFLFGPVAIVGTALSNPTPKRGMHTLGLSENESLFSDPTYLACYKKRAKDQLMGMELVGWASWILFYLVARSNN